MQRRFRQAYTALKEHSYISYAKMATIGGFCDLDIIVIKATAPDDLPLQEKYIYELLKIFTFSPSSFRAFSLSFTRRFGKTQCWRVALKCLVLLHRLLRSLPETSSYIRSDLLWSRSNGLISLYPCRFKDASSSSCSEDFTNFIQSYAHLLDETLTCFSLDRNESTTDSYDDQTCDENSSFSEKMRQVGRVLELLPQVQSLIEKALDCNPSRPAARSLLVRSAMKLILRDSFVCYAAFRRDIAFLLDNLFQMKYRCCISAFGIYKRAATQTNRLSEFYDSCKGMGLCGSYEYPFVDRIPQIHVQAMENFLEGMRRLTESSSSRSSSSSISNDSRLTSTEEEEGEKQFIGPLLKTVICTEWERFEDDEDEEEQPLLQLEMINTNNVGNWETILEASVGTTCVPRAYGTGILCGMRLDHGQKNRYDHKLDDRNEWENDSSTGCGKVQPYNPYSSSHNPYCQSYIV